MEEAGETSDGDDVFGDCNDLSEMEGNGSMDDELTPKATPMQQQHACSHTHTCNPPGPSSQPHTHTCIHTHTLLVAQQQDHHGLPSITGDSESLVFPHSVDGATLFSPPDDTPCTPASFLKKRPLGNREAVKKYREKKKAHIAFLEEQVQQLRVSNQELLKRLQGQAALESEVFHLRTLLAEFRGRIDGELGFHSRSLQHPKDPGIQQSLPGGYVWNSFSVPCGVPDVPCLNPFQEEAMVSSALQRSVFSCQKPTSSCETKQETRKRQSSKITGSMTVTECTEEG